MVRQAIAERIEEMQLKEQPSTTTQNKLALPLVVGRNSTQEKVSIYDINSHYVARCLDEETAHQIVDLCNHHYTEKESAGDKAFNEVLISKLQKENEELNADLRRYKQRYSDTMSKNDALYLEVKVLKAEAKKPSIDLQKENEELKKQVKDFEHLKLAMKEWLAPYSENEKRKAEGNE